MLRALRAFQLVVPESLTNDFWDVPKISPFAILGARIVIRGQGIRMEMKRYLCGFALLLVFVAMVPRAASAAISPDPYASRLISDDIPRFWQAFDASEKEGPSAYDRLYLKPGTPGLQDFVQDRIGSAQHLYETVSSHRAYYTSLRQASLDVARYEKAIRASFFALKYLYPDAKFPDVYFVIGALNSAGTSSDRGLIIGLDMYGRRPGMPEQELDGWLMSVIKPIDEVPYIVAHELIHFEQLDPTTDTLLSASIREGSADFIGELISGRQINELAHAYGSEHEAELWQEYRKRMNGKDLDGWLYSDSPGRPHDLGYWEGYRIAQSYYDRAPDKQKAVRDILNISDFGQFLVASGYNPLPPARK
jgi:hypothetical protein